MRANSRWDDFIDWLDFVVLGKFGLIRLKNHRIVNEFYRNWLVDVAKNDGRMNEGERSSVLSWERNDENKNE